VFFGQNAVFLPFFQ